MNFVSLPSDSDGEPIVTDSPPPNVVAMVDQQRAEATEILTRLVTNTLIHAILTRICPDDMVSIKLNATMITNELTNLDRGQAIGVINLAMERFANDLLDQEGYQSMYESMEMDTYRELAHNVAKGKGGE